MSESVTKYWCLKGTYYTTLVSVSGFQFGVSDVCFWGPSEDIFHWWAAAFRIFVALRVPFKIKAHQWRGLADANEASPSPHASVQWLYICRQVEKNYEFSFLWITALSYGWVTFSFWKFLIENQTSYFWSETDYSMRHFKGKAND